VFLLSINLYWKVSQQRSQKSSFKKMTIIMKAKILRSHALRELKTLIKFKANLMKMIGTSKM